MAVADHARECCKIVATQDALEGGAGAPPLQGAQPMPSHRPPDGKCRLQWQPTVTAPNRFGNPLQPPVSLLLGPPLRYLPF